MRDGTHLDAIIWHPVAEGRYPVLVECVGYDLEPRASLNGELYAPRVRRRRSERARCLRLRGSVHALPRPWLGRQPGWLRHHRVGGSAAVDDRPGWHTRRLLFGHYAV